MTEVTVTSPLRLSPLVVYSRHIASHLRHIDPVLATLVVMFGGLYLYSPDQAFRTVRYVAGELAHIGPWLAGSVMVAAFAKATRAAGTLGMSFALAKMISAVGMGMLAGFGTMLLIRIGWLDAPAALRITPSAAVGGCGSKPAAPIAEAPNSCCGSTAAPVAVSGCGSKTTSTVVWRFWTDAERSQRFLTSATSTGWFLVRWLAVAFAIESLMIAWLPVGAVGTWLGADAGPLAVPLAVAIGIPIYLNSFAAIPFVSGLIGLGMSPATGMAFMLATSATGFPAMVAVWALVKPRAFALYLGFAITGAMIAGYAYAAALALHI